MCPRHRFEIGNEMIAPNVSVRDAIVRLNQTPNDAMRAALYREIANNGLLALVVAHVPAGIDPNGTVLERGTDISMLTTTAPDGGEAIVAFTDVDAVRARIPNAQHIAMHAKDILQMVVDNHYAGLVLNPAGPWAAIPREDVSQILDGTLSSKGT